MNRFSYDTSTVPLIFVAPNGSEKKIDAPVQTNLMRIAKLSGVNMWARCGAGRQCGTCQVLLAAAAAALLPPPRPEELAVLEKAEPSAARADRIAADLADMVPRLSCQLYAQHQIAGIRLHIMSPEPAG